MDYQITWEPPNGFYVRFLGWVTPESAARLAREVTSDVRYDDLRYGIIDLTESPGHTFRRDDRSAVGSAMAEMIGARFSNQYMLEVAIATEPRMLNYLTTYAAFSTRPLQVFATLPEAREWLSQRTVFPSRSK
jgi:hypothetical protein